MQAGLSKDEIDGRRAPVVDVVPFAVRAASGWSWRLAVIVGAVYGIYRILLFFAPVVFPFFLAILFSALLAPLVNLFEGPLRNRALAVATTILAAVAVLIGGLALVGAEISDGIEDLGKQTNEGVVELTSRFKELVPANVRDVIQTSWDDVLGSSGDGQTGVFQAAWVVTGTAGQIATGFLLMIFCSIFLLFDGRSVWLWAVRLLPREARDAVDQAASKGWVTLSSFVRATIIVALADAIGIGVGAALLGVPLVVPIMVLVFLGAFIPVIGAVVTGGVAVLLAFVSGGLPTAALMLGVVIGVQQLESHVLQPFLLGRAVRVHPIAVVLSIGAGLLVGGILGALFAVPLIAVANTMISDLLSDDDEDACADEPVSSYQAVVDRDVCDMADTSGDDEVRSVDDRCPSDESGQAAT